MLCNQCVTDSGVTFPCNLSVWFVYFVCFASETLKENSVQFSHPAFTGLTLKSLKAMADPFWFIFSWRNFRSSRIQDYGNLKVCVLSFTVRNNLKLTCIHEENKAKSNRRYFFSTFIPSNSGSELRKKKKKDVHRFLSED